jgi:opacity protein-like surface antigen
MKNLAFSIVCVLCALSAQQAAAQTASNFYVRVDAGGSFPIDTTLAGEQNFSPSAMVGGGVGFKILPFLRTDVTASYRTDYNENATDPNTFLGQKSEIKSLAGFFNGYFDIPTGPLPIKPYIGAGVGAARNQTGTTSQFDPFTGNTASVDGATKMSFAYQAMLGVGFPIFPGITIDAGYHYVDLGRFTTAGGVSLNGTPGVPLTGRLKANEIQLGLRVGF